MLLLHEELWLLAGQINPKTPAALESGAQAFSPLARG